MAGPGLEAFLRGLFDYAGLFPPASLDLPGAVDAWRRHRRSADAWMLGRFIVPAARLDDLGALLGDEEAPLSVIAGVGDTRAGAARSLGEDAHRIRRFAETREGPVEAVETRLPLDVADAQDVAEHVLEMSRRLGETRISGVELWVEAPARADVDPVVRGLAAAHERLPEGPVRRVGHKLRCGGLEPAAFPSPDRVARTIAACRDAAVPLKLTAGLHHPVRHRDGAVGTMAHGFLNVVGAALVAHARGLGASCLEPILLEEQAEAFRLGEGFSWLETAVDSDEIARGRDELLTGIGTCSFDEPREDLARLGLLEVTHD